MRSLTISAALILLTCGASADDTAKNQGLKNARHLREKVVADLYSERTIQEGNDIQLAGEGSHRKLSSWLSLLGLVDPGPGHCLKGPLGRPCRDKHGGADGGGGGSGGGSSGGGGGGSSGGGGDGSSGGSSGGGGNSGTSAANSGGGGGNGGGGNGNGGSAAKIFSSTEGKIGLLTAAAAAASIAIAALFMENRKRNMNGPKHPLHGMIKKRVTLFSRMADRRSSATCRPEQAVEGSSTNYQLA